jgi:DNA-binding response OmpR family regulator
MSYPDKLLTYEMLENHIWDIEKSSEYNSLNVIVSRLRRKLGYDLKDCPIRNAYGEGYRFTP